MQKGEVDGAQDLLAETAVWCTRPIFHQFSDCSLRMTAGDCMTWAGEDDFHVAI
jgi:hypothetical protein